MTQTKGLLGEDEDDLFGPGSYKEHQGIDNNFKSQTL